MAAKKAPAPRRDKRDNDDSSTPGPGSPSQLEGKKRGPNRFNKRELARVFAAAKSAGAERVQFNPADGSLQAFFAAEQDSTAQAGDDLDKWMAEKNARQA